MERDVTSLSGEDYFEGKLCSDAESLSQGDKDYEDILELNQFDGLPYSSRFYKLLKERKELPVWKAKSEFMDTLAKGRFVVVSGSAKSGRSSQVSTAANVSHFTSCVSGTEMSKLSLLPIHLTLILKQIPQWCAEFCLSARFQHGMVVCTQVDTQQAVDLALRVADEMDVNIGHEVGYSIPLESCCTNDSVLRYVHSSSSYFLPCSKASSHHTTAKSPPLPPPFLILNGRREQKA